MTKGRKKNKESKLRLTPAKKTGQSAILSFSGVFKIALDKWKKIKRAKSLKQAESDKIKLAVNNKELKAITIKVTDSQKRLSIFIVNLFFAKMNRIRERGVIKRKIWPTWLIPPFKKGKIRRIRESRINGWFWPKDFFIITQC